MNSEEKILSISRLGASTEQDFYWSRQQGHVVNLKHPTAGSKVIPVNMDLYSHKIR